MNDLTARPAAAQPTRNLLIMHTPDRQDISDWLAVKQRIAEWAPDIDVRIGSNYERNSVTRRWQVSRPSVVLCVGLLSGYEPRGGTVYKGRVIDKLEQLERLARRGLPVPRTVKLIQDLAIDPAHWGPYAVAKPTDSAMGQGVRLVRTEQIATRCAELTLNGTRDIVLQPYIEHAEDGYPTEYRTLTMFGRALYSARNRWGAPRPPLEDIASDPNGIIASNNRTFGRVRTVWNDAEIVALAEQAHGAFPECPTLGVDIIRDANSGKLYVMEVNPMGFSWNFSSARAKGTFTADHIRDLYAQFGALDRVAKLLIEKTRTEAS